MPWGYAAAALVGAVGSNYASNKTEDAARMQLEQEQASLDYQKEIQALPLQYRDEALESLGGFYGLGEGGQQDIIDKAKASPFYAAELEQGRQGVGAGLSATGTLRGGYGPSTFRAQDMDVLNQAVDQQLQGLSSFAGTPIDTSGISQSYSNMGDISAQEQLTKGNIWGNYASSISSMFI